MPYPHSTHIPLDSTSLSLLPFASPHFQPRRLATPSCAAAPVREPPPCTPTLPPHRSAGTSPQECRYTSWELYYTLLRRHPPLCSNYLPLYYTLLHFITLYYGALR